MGIGIEDLRFTIYEGAGTHCRRNSEKRLPRGSVGAIPARAVSPHPDPLPPAFAARQSAAPARRRQGEGTARIAQWKADGSGLFYAHMALPHSRFSSFRVLESATCAGVL